MAAPGQHVIRWTAKERQKELEKTLQDALGIPSLLACVLVSRGFTEPLAAASYLNPSLDDLGSPRKLPDYIQARDEILGARERGETIFIHGDYDVDGVTSAALLTRFLQSVGAKVITHVPHRMKEGYGIHLNAVEAARATGAKLFLTCDCGVSAHLQVEAAKEAGMRVVVTDHHSIGETLPEAHAMVNPHRADSEYPYQELSGVGVAFRLCEGLTEELGYNRDRYRRAFLDLAVLGTVADVMPLTGENRIITRHGLKQLFETKKVGLRALLRESKVFEECNGKINARHIGFMLGPRLNAAGRIDDAARSLDLLLTSDEADAIKIAQTIEQINTQRKEDQKRTVGEAVQRVLDEGLHEGYTIVIGQEDWHPGIIGLVAGRLVEQFRRPSFVLTIGPDGSAKGSARSIPGFNLADCIRAFPDLVDGGGHAMAAGFSTHAELIPQISKAFNSYAAARLTPADFEIQLRAEAEVEPSEVTFATVEALGMLEPYGAENPEPLFSISGMRVNRIVQTKNPLHPKLILRAADDTGPLVNAMAFSQGERLAQYEPGFEGQFLIQVKIDEWRGSRSMKWEVRHFETDAATSQPLLETSAV
jgi:single-stranded-DNA-specific exonuclease